MDKTFFSCTIICIYNLNLYIFENFFYRNGRVCVWECTLEPDDWIEWEPPSKKERSKDSDSEDDIDIEKIIEKTEKQKAHAERKLLNTGNEIEINRT